MNLYIDLDGTTVDLVNPWIAAFREAGGEGDFDLSRYDFDHLLSDRDRAHFHHLLNSAGLFAHLPYLHGARNAITRAIKGADKAGDTVRFVSHPFTGNAAAGKVRWVQRYYSRDRLILISAENRLGLCCQGALLIDDNLDTVLDWSRLALKYGGCKAILVDQPWNLRGRDLSLHRVARSLADAISQVY